MEPSLETTTQIFSSTLESVDDAESIALEAARRAGLGKTVLENIGLAVHEVMTNAVFTGIGATLKKRSSSPSGALHTS